MEPIILASQSPQRAVLLKNLGLSCVVSPSDVDESVHPEQEPRKRAATLARLKAELVASKHLASIVVGCDTLVETADGTLLEKPTDADDARRMLRLQRGGISVVHSALHIVAPKKNAAGISSTRVHFADLTEATIEWWIRTGLWKDRSGGFQIDGQGQLLIKHVEGDWTGVVGLPVFLFGQLLREIGQPIDQ